MKLEGLDHCDVRVPSLVAVEHFYDALLPKLGLPRKHQRHVGADGEWYYVDDNRPCNAISYHTPQAPGRLSWFIDFVEEPKCVPSKTRIAFALDSEANLKEAEQIVRDAGGRNIEWSIEGDYPAFFFEDPAGTLLEICARRKGE